MNDQANALRGLMERRTPAVPLPSDSAASKTRCHTIAVTSGKGGVGKSNIALNLAVALARAGQSVLLMDVNWGIGNLELLSGLSGRWNFSDVISGTHRLEDVVQEGPADVKLLSGVGSLADAQHAVSAAESFEQITRFQQEFEFVVIDLGTGMLRLLRPFVSLAHRVLNVTTTEPPAIAEAYAMMKSLAGIIQPRWEVLINQSEQASQSESLYQRLKQTTRVFLKTELAWAGAVPHDAHVPSAVFRRKPFVLDHPQCEAAQAVKQLARRLINQRDVASPQSFTPFPGWTGPTANPSEQAGQPVTST